MSVEAFPLHWPAGWPRTAAAKRQRARFGERRDTGYSWKSYSQGKSHSAALTFLREELRRMGASGVVISTNLELRRDGLPYASRKDPEDPGAAVYFTMAGRQQCIPCDRWDRVPDNLYAVGKAVEALRGLERWGSGRMVEAAFAGFKALPAHAMGLPWWQVLDVEPDASLDEIEASYRLMAKVCHPDTGAPREHWDELQEALRQARAARRP